MKVPPYFTTSNTECSLCLHCRVERMSIEARAEF